ncbi:hypothetical protein RGQ29_002741 [Quercus rubra]|uniref:ASCH domain-containing protein n=1 Tax=Quercus rubra TaxID=3512 RepID=A0AAN7IE22_QUERU|nr:hypothetical protein RGQ29_002741 [Quercus rubra]
MSPVNLKDCMEEVVRYTLESHINETLEFDLGLSKSFCSDLLKLDPNDPNTTTTSDVCFIAFKEDANSLWFKLLMQNLLKEKKNEWQKLVLDKGSEIVNILKSVVHELHVQEPFFSQLKDGKKTIEGRCAIGDYNRIGSGTLIRFNKCVVFEVQDAHWYASFSEMLGQRVLPRFFLELKPLKKFSRYTNLQEFLHRSERKDKWRSCNPCFESGCSALCLSGNPTLCCTLTHGARALAKHANRSTSKYWGTLEGSDYDKNRLAMDVVCHIIEHCGWLNVHIVPPHGAVFEIRVADGYGARWSKDGCKKSQSSFLGFLPS